MRLQLDFDGTGEELAELIGIIRECGADDDAIREQVARLAAGRTDLAAAVTAMDPGTTFTATRAGDCMEPIDTLVTEVSEDVTVMGSAAVLIRGFNQRLADGIAAARAGDFAKLDQMKADLDTAGTDLAAAVAENTPAAGGDQTRAGGKKK